MGAVAPAPSTRRTGDPAVAIKHVRATRATPSVSRSRPGCCRCCAHPRVVKVLDYFSDERGMYLVMELVQGTDLHLLLKAARATRGSRSPQAVEFIRQGL